MRPRKDLNWSSHKENAEGNQEDSEKPRRSGFRIIDEHEVEEVYKEENG
jgi:hypothetical protein